MGEVMIIMRPLKDTTLSRFVLAILALLHTIKSGDSARYAAVRRVLHWGLHHWGEHQVAWESGWQIRSDRACRICGKIKREPYF